MLLAVGLALGVGLGASEDCEELVGSAMADVSRFGLKIGKNPKTLVNVLFYKPWKHFAK